MDTIREKLAEKFRDHKLPRSLPSALHLTTLEGNEQMTINGGRGTLCCVCDEMITHADEFPLEFTYPGRSTFAFHQPCERLWQEEREKPLRRKVSSLVSSARPQGGHNA